ncbi:MAG: hypothetical protein R3266_07605, partial [Gemmatimonadota bacterium]|nr:hypothetical protein [Gemmatimonadota bacterium]
MNTGSPGSPGYEAARHSAAFFAGRDRRVVEIAGPRALQIVNGLVTNTISGIPEGRVRYAFMLDPKGRPVVDLRLLPLPPGAGGPDEEGVWLDIPAAGLDALTRHLQKYVPPIFATVRNPDVAVASFIGPRALDATRIALAALGRRADPRVEALGSLQAGGIGHGGLCARREQLELEGFDLYLPATEAEAAGGGLADAAEAVGGAEGTRNDWETLRIEGGLPAYGSEITPDRLAQEAGQDARAISYEKGCFTGQEVVARIHYRGHVNRHLRGLRAPDPELLDADELFHGERPVATVHSRTVSPRFGPIAVGYVRREVEPGTLLAREIGAEPSIEVID